MLMSETDSQETDFHSEDKTKMKNYSKIRNITEENFIHERFYVKFFAVAQRYGTDFPNLCLLRVFCFRSPIFPKWGRSDHKIHAVSLIYSNFCIFESVSK